MTHDHLIEKHIREGYSELYAENLYFIGLIQNSVSSKPTKHLNKITVKV